MSTAEFILKKPTPAQKRSLSDRRLVEIKEKGSTDYFKAQVWCSLRLGGNFLCGTTQVTNLAIFFGPSESCQSWEAEKNTPKKFCVEKRGVDWPYYYRTGRHKDSTLYITTPAFVKALRKLQLQEKNTLISLFFNYIVNQTAANSNLVVLGGRVTNSPYAGDPVIRSPELAKYILENRLGVISASHMHQNVNHTAKSDFSCYQYWFWTYQKKGSRAVPRVASIDPKYCGVFAGNLEEKQVRSRFLTYWSKRLKSKKTDKVFKPRYEIDEANKAA